MTSIFEYNKEEEERKLRTAERQAGYDEGYDSGYDRGYGRGYGSGFDMGYGKGIAENLCKLVDNFMPRRMATLEEACDALGISVEDYKKAEKLFHE